MDKDFRYYGQTLNSNEFLDFLEKKMVLEKQILESESDKDKLLRIYKLFQITEHDKRENAMLQNIYNFSIENRYKQAVFLIGSEHRKSIILKIAAYEKMSPVKLNWTMYGGK